MRRAFGLSAAVLATLALGACAPLGPAALRANRPLFNEAVQQTESQQLLLNIVRQRYSDPVMFLDVTSISSGTSRQFNTNLLAKILPAGRDEIQDTVGASFGESPIIFYAPNTGEKFVRQMLLPLDLRAVTVVLQAGWSVERVLLVAGESLNHVRNGAPGGADPNTFAKLADALRDLQRRGELAVGAEPGPKDSSGKEMVQSVVLTITAEASKSEPYRLVCAALAIACDGRPIRLKLAFGGASDGTSATLATRSLLSAMYYLAQGVDVPPSDVAAGVVTPTADSKTRSDLFHVRTSAREPAAAAVKVFYRETWFYIADDDADTKTTFALVSLFVTLQAGDVSKVTPLVSLPGN